MEEEGRLSLVPNVISEQVYQTVQLKHELMSASATGILEPQAREQAARFGVIFESK